MVCCSHILSDLNAHAARQRLSVNLDHQSLSVPKALSHIIGTFMSSDYEIHYFYA